MSIKNLYTFTESSSFPEKDLIICCQKNFVGQKTDIFMLCFVQINRKMLNQVLQQQQSRKSGTAPPRFKLISCNRWYQSTTAYFT